LKQTRTYLQAAVNATTDSNSECNSHAQQIQQLKQTRGFPRSRRYMQQEMHSTACKETAIQKRKPQRNFQAMDDVTDSH
jgi:hypothetical protein